MDTSNFRRAFQLTTVALAVQLAVACGGGDPEQTTNAAGLTEPSPEGAWQTEQENLLPAKPLSETLEVPAVPAELLSRIEADLYRNHGPQAALLLRSQKEVAWPNANYGCQSLGQGAIAQPIDGYQVIFEVEGQQYDYRSDVQGDFILCEDQPPEWRQQNPAS